MRGGGPRFDQPVPQNGYAWWYADALSDDGECGLTIIAFVGSVFSPYYAASRRRGVGQPLDHCAVNVALYGRRSKHWALTERRETSVTRDETVLAIGNSALEWNGERLTVEIAELAIPRFSRLRGRVSIYPQAITACDVALDLDGRHHWRPIAPRARVEVEMTQPALRWSGSGYLDTNWGSQPLEDEFTDWTWSRGDMGDGAVILYDASRRHGGPLSLAYRFDRSGDFELFAPPPRAPLPGTGWRIARETRSDDPRNARVLRTLEDTPFYARSIVSTRLLGTPVRAMHESLSLSRFASRWVQTLLPFRMPRSGR